MIERKLLIRPVHWGNPLLDQSSTKIRIEHPLCGALYRFAQCRIRPCTPSPKVKQTLLSSPAALVRQAREFTR